MEAQLGHVIKPDAGVVETPVSDVMMMRRLVEELQVMSLLQEVVPAVSSLSLPPPSPPTPLAPGSPYDARPGIYRFRGTPTPAPLSLSPPLSL